MVDSDSNESPAAGGGELEWKSLLSYVQEEPS